ncbi:Hypothetical predicted protein, partial [Podarcis lilfordi]
HGPDASGIFLERENPGFRGEIGVATGCGSPPKPLWRETRGSRSQRSQQRIAWPLGNSVKRSEENSGRRSRHQESIVSPPKAQPQACK